MKTTYSTITLRYLHDVVTGEFANIGVVLYSPDQRFLEVRFTTSYERLNAIFLKIDHLHYRALMRYMANRFDEIAADIRDGLNVPPVTALKEIVRQVLPPDDSSLQWSEPSGGFTEDAATTLEDLFKRLVERYIAGAEQVSRTDEEIASRSRRSWAEQRKNCRRRKLRRRIINMISVSRGRMKSGISMSRFHLIWWIPAASAKRRTSGWAVVWHCMTRGKNSRFISFWASRDRMKRGKHLKMRSIF
jgi:Protein of unknown function (DUF3037)